jgi:glycerol-3-phosphate cytidylyltransferase-like family protein
MTTTVVAVMHDAHVCARATFVAARTAMVQVATARRARAATRAATRAEVRATTKVVRAANVVAKEAAEKHASAVNGHAVRVANRAAHKAYCAPMVRAAKKEAAVIAKVVRAMRTAALIAARATRMAAKVTKTIATAMVAIDKATTQYTVVSPATTVCVAAPMHSAHVRAYHAANKAAAKAANKAHASIRAPRVPMNTPEKRASITMACNAVRAAVHAAQAKTGTSISNTKVQARLAQGAAQRAANAARKAATPAKVRGVQVAIVRTGPTKVKGPKRVRVVRVHTVESALAQVAKKAAIVKAKEDKEIAKARRWALRKAAFAARKAAMEQIAADAWMLKGVWLPEDLLRAANDWSYAVRISAFKEARAIAYAKAPATQVAVAA